jgi:hypothetical protein
MGLHVGKVDVAQPVGDHGRQDKEAEQEYRHIHADPLNRKNGGDYCKNAMSFRMSVNIFTRGEGSPLVTTITGDETRGALGTFNPATM